MAGCPGPAISVPYAPRTSVLHVISVAQFALTYTRGWAANAFNHRARIAPTAREG